MNLDAKNKKGEGTKITLTTSGGIIITLFLPEDEADGQIEELFGTVHSIMAHYYGGNEATNTLIRLSEMLMQKTEETK